MYKSTQLSRAHFLRHQMLLLASLLLYPSLANQRTANDKFMYKLTFFPLNNLEHWYCVSEVAWLWTIP
uniref:Putative secreted protein n=1 Tax=Rhipicephalus microplus TaxID=6941 RepID=A0A6M2DC15_RHIMP